MKLSLKPLAALLACAMTGGDWSQYGGKSAYTRDYGNHSGSFIRVIPTDLGINEARLLPPSGQSKPATRVTDGQKYGSVTNLSGSGTTADQLVLARSSSTRVFLAIQNNDTTNNLFVAFGGSATTGSGIKIAPGQTLFFDAFIPQDDIHVVADAGTPAFVVFYSNKGENES
jgi:hypothetical protein